MALSKYFNLVRFIGLCLLCATAEARVKTYQSTKLIELTAGAEDFCFVVQTNDIAYIAVARGHVPNVMIVGDPIQIRIENDHLFVRTKVTTKWAYDNNEIEGRIRVRQRMTVDTKLPSCALAVTLH